MARIWYQSFVHPIEQAPYIDRLQAMLSKVASPGMNFEVHGLDPPDHSFHALTEFRCAAQVIGNALAAEKAGYDAFVIGHFQEPGLIEIRGAVDIPVIGLGEANLLAALSMGGRLGLVTIDPVFVPWHDRQIRMHGLGATRSVARVRDQLVRALRARPSPSRPLDDDEEALSLALLAGYPDRVARRRAPLSDDLFFAEGGSAKLDPGSVVQEAALLVCVDATELYGRRVVRAASGVEPEAILELFPGEVEDHRGLSFDETLGQVIEVAELRYGGLSLDRSVRRDVAGPEVARILAAAALRHGVDRIWDADAREQLARRLAFAAAHGLPARPLDDALLAEAIASIADGARGFNDLGKRSLVDAVLALEPPEVLARLSSYAPETVAIPGRPRVPVSYEVDRDPWIESRLQDFFGAKAGPSIAGGRVPLTLHLLAPNKRAVQVTTDLAGFWARHYPSIRKELMRRYPRHAWPEDPTTAEPSKPTPRRR